MNPLCAVTGCPGPRYARGWCVTHYRRWQRHGDPRPDQPIRARQPGADGYSAALNRLRATRGRAAELRCADCAADAACWSYDGTDPDERTDPDTGRRFSLDLDHYRPRCRFCHRRAVLDRAADLPTGAGVPPGLDVERAVRIYQAGATARGIASLMGVSPDAVIRALRSHGVTLRPSGRPPRATTSPET
ncbi:MAG: hypothetical protein ACT4O0_03070 [Pseudonocardia sp.]